MNTLNIFMWKTDSDNNKLCAKQCLCFFIEQEKCKWVMTCTLQICLVLCFLEYLYLPSLLIFSWPLRNISTSFLSNNYLYLGLNDKEDVNPLIQPMKRWIYWLHMSNEVPHASKCRIPANMHWTISKYFYTVQKIWVLAVLATQSILKRKLQYSSYLVLKN